MKNKITLLTLLASMSFSLSGCNLLSKFIHKDNNQNEQGENNDSKPIDEDNTIGVKSVLVKGTGFVYVNKTTQLEAEVNAIGDFETTVMWSSLDTSVATVDENGLVTGVKEGTATIKAISKADNTVFGTLEVFVSTPNPTGVDVTTSSTKYPWYLRLGDNAKKYQLSLKHDSGIKLDEIPQNKKQFSWTCDKEGIVTLNVNETNSLICNVTPKAVGEVLINATSTFDSNITMDFLVRVIDMKSTDYIWQYVGANDKKQFGYVSSEATKGAQEGNATLSGLTWKYYRNRVTSMGSGYGALTFGKGSSASEKENAEDLTLTNVNTKKVSRIVVDTASANSLAKFTVSIGGKEVINTKAPKARKVTSKDIGDCTPLDSGVLSEALSGDIEIKWDNDDFDSDIHTGNSGYSEGPGAIYLKAIRIYYA